MVDYSKWDKFQDSDSEDDERSSRMPKVHTIAEGSSIQINSQGASVIPPSLDDTSSVESDTLKQEPIPCSAASSSRRFKATGSAPTHTWEQDRQEVTLWIPVDSTLKGADVVISVEESMFTVQSKTEVILSKELRYKVEVPEDGVDWELITTDGVKQLKVTLVKHVYIPGSVIWWSNVFNGDPEVDVSQIEGRKKSSFKDNWEQAHAMFREKKNMREQVNVSL
mmetsp:Transcript_8944/g.13440  ORF Transcript_8944/g.13440 Transcript_8944/m.13440 type:complete len:223 (+) Transcript_8944:51-719(+)